MAETTTLVGIYVGESNQKPGFLHAKWILSVHSIHQPTGWFTGVEGVPGRKAGNQTTLGGHHPPIKKQGLTNVGPTSTRAEKRNPDLGMCFRGEEKKRRDCARADSGPLLWAGRSAIARELGADMLAC